MDFAFRLQNDASLPCRRDPFSLEMELPGTDFLTYHPLSEENQAAYVDTPSPEPPPKKMVARPPLCVPMLEGTALTAQQAATVTWPLYEDICGLPSDDMWFRVGRACREFTEQKYAQGVLALLKYNCGQALEDDKCPESFYSGYDATNSSLRRLASKHFSSIKEHRGKALCPRTFDKACKTVGLHELCRLPPANQVSGSSILIL